MYKSKDIVIVSASRTPIGKFNGSLSNTPAHELGAIVIKSVLEKANIAPSLVDEVIMGQILTAGQGQNPARQAAVLAGIPFEKPSWIINQLCGSGLKSVIIAYQQIIMGDSNIMIAGGQENMSLAPHYAHIRSGHKMGSFNMQDSMIVDALLDVFYNYHMGITAENIAKKWKISREEQDNFAYNSQKKATHAQKEGYFIEEICPIAIRSRGKEIMFKEDEYIRRDINISDIKSLEPIFIKEDGTVTAANASGINDGAAAVLLMTYEMAMQMGLSPLAKISSWGQAGVDPAIMGSGPIPAVRNALKKVSWTIGDLDLVELNEAFASQSCACAKDLEIPDSKLNVNGGAIALGHPVGASGTRILVSLLHEMKRRKLSKGLASLCVGGGMGIALCVEMFH